MENREILEKLGIEMPQPENQSGFQDPRKLGMIWFSNSQLKNVAKMLGEKAQSMTKDEIENEIIANGVK